jgi:TonB family protein
MRLSLCVAAALVWAYGGVCASEGVTEPPLTAGGLLLEDCGKNLRNAIACSALGVRYAAGDGVEKNLVQGLAYLKASCRSDFETPCFYRAFYSLDQSIDVHESLAQLERGCKKERSVACWLLGALYGDGHGVPADALRAEALLRKAGDLDHPGAFLALGLLIERRGGDGNDAKRALDAFSEGCNRGDAGACERACDRGASRACLILGRLLDSGDAKNGVRIEASYQKACELGDGIGCAWAGQKARDALRAVDYMRHGCELGNGMACAGLGNLHNQGRGVPKDMNAAARFYGLACEKGHRRACRSMGAFLSRGGIEAESFAQLQPYLAKGCGEDLDCRALVEKGGIPDGWDAMPYCTPECSGSIKPVQVGGDFSEPRKIKHAVPVYPLALRQARAQGRVEMEFSIDTAGRVVNVRVLDGPAAFFESAVAAVRQWQYEPATLDGVPVLVKVTTTTSFTIE